MDDTAEKNDVLWQLTKICLEARNQHARLKELRLMPSEIDRLWNGLKHYYLLGDRNEFERNIDHGILTVYGIRIKRRYPDYITVAVMMGTSGYVAARMRYNEEHKEYRFLARQPMYHTSIITAGLEAAGWANKLRLEYKLINTIDKASAIT